MKKREKENDFLKRLLSLREIKLTLLFLLLACIQVSARTYSQDKITLNLQSTELKKVLTIIERKSNYHFLYTESIIANKPRIDLTVKE